VVARAARRGADSLERGLLIPLPLLLDLGVLLRARSFGRPSFRPVRPRTSQSAAYETWLEDFVSPAARLLGISGRRRQSSDGIDWDFTPLLSGHFPISLPKPAVSAEFRKLASGEGVEAVLRAWAGARSSAGWKDWFPLELNGFQASTWQDSAWAQFSTASGSEWLDERCDHEAARIYLEATNPSPDLDQRRRIWRLRRRRPLYEPNPLTQSYEEQALYYGAITTATLASEEYGEFKIVNHSDYRISNPPPVRPPIAVHIHLCWAHGYGAMTRTMPAAVFPNSNQKLGGARAAEVSVLQSFSALLFDDWRSALILLDARLHAHYGKPNAAQDDFGRPAERWKPSKTSGPMPPPRAMSRFFQRATWLSVEECGLSWREDPSGSAWWCLVLLKSELSDFGIRRLEGGSLQSDRAFSALDGVLPSCISTVIVLDPAERDGAVYNVMPAINRGSVHLRPLPSGRPSGELGSSFESLRLRGLDALLDALEARS
jgi:hypothetical protein